MAKSIIPKATVPKAATSTVADAIREVQAWTDPTDRHHSEKRGGEARQRRKIE
jgi:hypothetical protein